MKVTKIYIFTIPYGNDCVVHLFTDLPKPVGKSGNGDKLVMQVEMLKKEAVEYCTKNFGNVPIEWNTDPRK